MRQSSVDAPLVLAEKYYRNFKTSGPVDMSADISQPRYNKMEELINGLTHAIATILSVTGLVLMVYYSSRYGDAYHIISSAVYGATLILLYTSSTLYHLVSSGPVKNVFQQLDHAMIYLLIAGTYTPYTLVNLRGPWGWSVFGTVWGLALSGVMIELFSAKRIRWLSVSLYLGLGWLMVIAIKPLVENLATGGLILLFSGGLFYSLGVIFYIWKRLAFQHAIWHVFVMAGSMCHFFSIFFYVIPPASGIM